MNTHDQNYNPIAAFFRACGFGPKEQPKVITPDQQAKMDLDAAEIELLEAEKEKEAAYARVEKLKMRIRRLQQTTKGNT